MKNRPVGHPLYLDRYVLYGEAGAALLAGAGLQRIGLAPSPLLPPGLLRDESLILLRTFTVIARRQFKGITVTLWLRR